MKVKICGLKYPENIKAIAELSPDYMGFICYALSPRFFSGLNTETWTALPNNVLKTGVFVNENTNEILRLIDIYHFNAIQLHGDEDSEFCKLLKDKTTTIKAFGMHSGFDFDQLNKFATNVDYFLFDTQTDNYGGSGKKFDWNLLDKYKLDIPFFLSGGLSLENLKEISLIKHPQFYGIDLNSKFEIEPGLKDIEKLKKAFELLK